jgi:hypothetical protein
MSEVGHAWVTEIKRGQAVVARSEADGREEAIGEAIDVLYVDDVAYLHILRYGPGHDELYVPSTGVDRVVGNHIYLHLSPADLLAQPWHLRPEPSQGPAADLL